MTEPELNIYTKDEVDAIIASVYAAEHYERVREAARLQAELEDLKRKVDNLPPAAEL